MHRYIIFVVISIIVLSGWGFLSYGTWPGYQSYLDNWEYRRLHPELIPAPDMIRLFDMGHTTSYASYSWLSLIQYIGDNVGGNRFLDFSHRMLSQITSLHPYFTRPYEIDLILAPVSSGENMTIEQIAKNKTIIANAIELGKKGIPILCNTAKIAKIQESPISDTLWKDTSVKNPCASGMLPYYIAFTLHQTGENKTEASTYYKIATMNNDAPQVSRILSILALSADGDYLATATNFALIGSSGYDVEPYTCRTLAISLTRDLIRERKPDITWISELRRQESSLEDTRDPRNPLSNSSDNCYDMTTRSIKAIYLDYIADMAKWTDAKNGDDLIDLWKLDQIPTIKSQSGYSVWQKGGIWEYQAR